MVRAAAFLIIAASVAGCATYGYKPQNVLRIPYVPEAINADGKLEEPCYARHTPLTSFVVAAEPGRQAPATTAWLFWNEQGLICTFQCADTTPAWAAPSPDERDVDGQDRAELFLWNGDTAGPYFCIEAAPAGAVHDYEARFYRKFNDGWQPAGGWRHEAMLRDNGYAVEMFLPKQALEAMGLKLEPGACLKVGLFRADFDKLNGSPTWITWVDHGRAPDFHTADSFGNAIFYEPLFSR